MELENDIYLIKVMVSSDGMEQAERRIRSAAFKPPLIESQIKLLADRLGKSYLNVTDLASRNEEEAVLRLLARHPNWKVRRNVALNMKRGDETLILLREDGDDRVKRWAMDYGGPLRREVEKPKPKPARTFNYWG